MYLKLLTQAGQLIQTHARCKESRLKTNARACRWFFSFAVEMEIDAREKEFGIFLSDNISCVITY